jgi:hypothetical protein
MKTTLMIDDGVMRRVKALAVERGSTISAVVDDFLRRGLAEEARGSAEPRKPPSLPTYPMGRPRVDVSDRQALEAAMEREAAGVPR